MDEWPDVTSETDPVDDADERDPFAVSESGSGKLRREAPTSRRRFLTTLGTGGFSLLAGGVAGRFASQRRTTTGASASTSTSARAVNALLSGGTLSVAAVLARVGPSVVTITAHITEQQGPFSASGEASGTGIILSTTGEILTNAHVVSNATSIEVKIDGVGSARSATLVASDTAADLALLRVSNASSFAPAPLGRSADLAIGDDVVAIGNALALAGGPTVTRGIVSALGRNLTTDTASLTHLIQTDAAISSGNSGGPLVDAAGTVIGICTAVATSSGTTAAENVGFAIASDTARTVLKRLRGVTT